MSLAVNILILILTFGGLVSNYFPLPWFNTGTLLTDACIAFILLVTMGIISLSDNPLIRNGKIVTVVFLLCMVCLLKLMLDVNPVRERFMGFRNLIIYMSVVVALYSTKIYSRDIRHILTLLKYCGLFIAIFGLIQFVFYYQLPTELRYLKIRGVELGFSHYGIVRPNGLVGNTLQYSTFLLITLCIVYYDLLKRRTAADRLILLIISLGIFASLTRATIFGFVICIFLINHFCNRSNLIPLAKFGVFAAIVFLLLDPNLKRLFFERIDIFGPLNVGTNISHYEDIRNSLVAIRNSPLLGIGIGSQGSSATSNLKVITDGFWFSTVLEFGIPLFLFYLSILVMILKVSVRLLKNTKDPVISMVCALFLTLSIYFFLSNFINSAFDRINYILYWVLAGVIINCNRVLLSHQIKNYSKGLRFS